MYRFYRRQAGRAERRVGAEGEADEDGGGGGDAERAGRDGGIDRRLGTSSTRAANATSCAACGSRPDAVAARAEANGTKASAGPRLAPAAAATPMTRKSEP
jgi:hypothetical protein